MFASNPDPIRDATRLRATKQPKNNAGPQQKLGKFMTRPMRDFMQAIVLSGNNVARGKVRSSIKSLCFASEPGPENRRYGVTAHSVEGAQVSECGWLSRFQ